MFRISSVHVFDHPLIQHKLTLIRDRNTGTKQFRELVEEVAYLMVYEMTRDLPMEEVQVQTPVAAAKAKVLAGKKLCIVPVLRAGLGMADGVLSLIPAAKVGHIGLYRDPQTLQPVEYYVKLPSDLPDREIILIDPMLATGGSAVAAADFLKRAGARNIRFMGLIAAPEGIRVLQAAHPEIDIFVAAVDDRLNEHSYIVPGLGDAGDRLFGTS